MKATRRKNDQRQSAAGFICFSTQWLEDMRASLQRQTHQHIRRPQVAIEVDGVSNLAGRDDALSAMN